MTPRRRHGRQAEAVRTANRQEAADIEHQHLQDGVDEGIISPAQAESLWALWQQQQHGVPQFDFTHILYYLGGLLAIGAMTLFMNLGWERFGGWGIVGLCALYALAGLGLLRRFEGKKRPVPAGICAVFVVALVPLAAYGLQQGLGVWPAVGDYAYRDYHRWIEWHWLYMELATLAVAALMLYCYRYPFLLLPVAVTLWYLSMDVTDWVVGDPDWAVRKIASLVFGLGMLALALWADVRSRRSSRDYAFWLYLFGVLTFWGGLMSMESDSELSKLACCAINIGLIGIGAVLVRRVFVVFGAMGVAAYVGHLADKVFQDSWLFPISLTLLGLLLVLAGVWWQKHEAQLTRRLRGRLPAAWRKALPHGGE